MTLCQHKVTNELGGGALAVRLLQNIGVVAVSVADTVVAAVVLDEHDIFYSLVEKLAPLVLHRTFLRSYEGALHNIFHPLQDRSHSRLIGGVLLVRFALNRYVVSSTLTSLLTAFIPMTLNIISTQLKPWVTVL